MEEKAFTVNKALKQSWKHNRYSYRDTPRPDHALMLVIHGSILFETSGTKLEAHAGDVIFLPKHSHYEAIFESETQDYLVNFDTPSGDPRVLEPTRLCSNAPLPCYQGCEALVDAVLLEFCTSLRIKGLFYLLLDSIAKSMVPSSSLERSLVDRIKERLCEDERTLSEIAKDCGLSASVLRKEFKEHTGVSPASYRLHHKLTRAKYLLESTDLSVSEIAEQLHFYDAAYFCKLFKRTTGITPLQFAKNKHL